VGQPGGQQAAGDGIGGEVAGDIQPGRGGHEGERVGVAEPEQLGDDGDALIARRLQHGLPLLIGEPSGERRGERGSDAERGHDGRLRLWLPRRRSVGVEHVLDGFLVGHAVQPFHELLIVGHGVGENQRAQEKDEVGPVLRSRARTQ
jgi:hypothetical protein